MTRDCIEWIICKVVSYNYMQIKKNKKINKNIDQIFLILSLFHLQIWNPVNILWSTCMNNTCILDQSKLLSIRKSMSSYEICFIKNQTANSALGKKKF